MADKLTIWTYDWVPTGPRGFVRDLRLRWAAEEAGLAYDVRTIAFDDRQTNHLDRQPYGQVPFLDDGEVRLFESGACLLHMSRKSEALMPRDVYADAMGSFYTFNNESPLHPFEVDAKALLAEIPVPLITLRDWAAKQDWSPDQGEAVGSLSG